jgi:uncharacterized protein YjiS (DUF1127 family)
MTQAILAAHSYSTRAIELLFESFRTFVQYRIERKAIRQTEKELSRLSDNDLTDIGICRGDIYHIARSKSTIENCKANRNLRGWV